MAGVTRLNNSANTCGKIVIVSLPLSRHNIHNRANKSEDGFERHVMTTKRVTTLRDPLSGPGPVTGWSLRVSRPGSLSLATLSLTADPAQAGLSLRADVGLCTVITLSMTLACQ